MNDKNLHRFSSDPGDYPAPDIPADAAWSAMDQMLNTAPAAQTPAKAAASKPGSFLIRNGARLLATAGIAGIVAVSVILLIHRNSAGKQSSPDLIIQTATQTNRTELPDNTLIIADEQSRISVQTGQSAATVIENGAAFFQTKDSSSHLNIRAGSVTIQGSSVQLYVVFDSAHATSSIFVLSGSVNINDGNKSTVANAGSAFHFDEKSKQLNAAPLPDPNVISFATRIFEFDATPLADVIPFLEKAYGIRIEVKSQAIRNCSISAKFENMPLRTILDIMSRTIGFEYKLDDINKVVVIDGENECK